MTPKNSWKIYAFNPNANFAGAKSFAEKSNFVFDLAGNADGGMEILLSTYLILIYAQDNAQPRFPRLEMTLKLNLFPFPKGSDNLTQTPVYAIQDYTDESAKTSRYFYFVSQTNYIAKQTTELTLRMDTLNTYPIGLTRVSGKTQYEFEKETLVLREHIDRWIKGKNCIFPIVDKTDEGFSLPTFPSTREKIVDIDASTASSKCYLVYKTTSDLSTLDTNAEISPLIGYDPGIETSPTREPSETSFSFSDTGIGQPITYVFRRWLNPNLKKLKITVNETDSTGAVSFVTYDYEIDSRYQMADAVCVSYGGWGVGGVSNVTIDYVNITPSGGVVVGDSKRYFNQTPYYPSFTADNVNYSAKVPYFITSKSAVDYLSTFTEYSDYDAGNGSGGIEVASMAVVNRYDPRNIKIIALPYSPITWTDGEPEDGWTIDQTTGLCTPVKAGFSAKRKINFVQLSEIGSKPFTYDSGDKAASRDDSFEPKQYASAFYSCRLVYDSFSLALMFERMEWSGVSATSEAATPDLSLYFKPTSSVNSKLTFSIVENQTDGSANVIFDEEAGTLTYEPPLDWPFVMVCARNNDLPIFSMAYLNYMINGYNWDLKKNRRELAGDAIGLITKVADTDPDKFSFAGLAGNLYSTIQRQIARDENIARTLANESMKATSVAGSDDLDLFEDYSDNKLWLIKGEPNPVTKQYLLDLFYFYGYTRNIREVPNVLSRVNFNYLQADIRLSPASMSAEVLDDLQAKFREGVTYLHAYADPVALQPLFDLEQTKLNLEVRLAN